MTTPLASLTAALADRYRLERELGAGGMATVYLAEDVRHRRKVAVKVLREDLGASLGADRFVREISIAANLTHPHILPLYDSGEAAGHLFYVMPFVDGATLREKLAQGGELPIAEAVRLLRDIAEAMAYAHAHGVVHRDIKPENVMLSGRHALVADFGVAKAVGEASGSSKVTTVGIALGTPAYMAPEQATADPMTDHRADIYAFGVLAYELLTGRQPFTGNSPQEVLAAHVTRAAEPVSMYRASIPAPLAALVMRCLEKRPADRWQRADELVAQLEALQTPSGGTMPTAPLTWARRSRRLLWTIGAVLALAVVGATITAKVRGRTGAAAPTRDRIAVLPFENRTGDKSRDNLGALAADWVTRGLSDAKLMEVVSASVVSQAIAEAASRKEEPLAAVTSSTGATKLVTGTFYSLGDSLRFEAEILDASTRSSVTGIRPSVARLSDAMQAIDSVRHRVLGAVAQWVGNADLLQYAPPPSLEAYQLVLRAEEAYDAARYGDMEKYYRQAFGLDTAYVLAGEGLVNALWLTNRLPEADSVLRRVEKLPIAAPGDAFLVKVLRGYLDGNRQVVYDVLRGDSASLGDGNLLVQWELEALALSRPREAIRIAERVNKKSPDVRHNPTWSRVVAEAWRMLGEEERALQEIRKTRELFPTTFRLARDEAAVLAALGREDELKRALQAAAAQRGYGGLLLDVAGEQFMRGDTVSGRATARKAIEWYDLQPAGDSLQIAQSVAWARRLSGSAEDLRKVQQMKCDSLVLWCWGSRGVAAAILGDTATARAAARQLERMPLMPRLRGARVFGLLAQIYAALGENDRAVGCLRDAFVYGEGWGVFIRRTFAPFPRLREHPGFKELMRPKG